MNVDKIEKLEDLIHLDEDSTIVGQKISRLTAPGDNYGSLMLSVIIKIKNPKGNEELHLVAKMLPPNEVLQEAFDTQVTFINEIAFYKHIVPTLRNFQKEHGVQKVIDFFPKYYGSRINLNGGTKVDSDAVLLLENLKLSGFVNIDRIKGFDLEGSKLVIKDLAYLHAVPIVLKLQKPEVFDKEIKIYLRNPRRLPELQEMGGKLLNVVESIKECKPHFEKVKEAMIKAWSKAPREPFATISHCDVWVNNIMVKLEKNKPVANKLIDFQGYRYGSPAKDLLFFIFAGVQSDTIIKHCDNLIKFYHETFIQVLKELHCGTQQFSLENFMTEMVAEGSTEFIHTIFMLFPIFMPKGTQKELSEITVYDMMDTSIPPSKEHIEKLILVVKEFVKRGWI